MTPGPAFDVGLAICDGRTLLTNEESSENKRWRVQISESPRLTPRAERQDLRQVLAEHDSRPLSFRPTRGFWDRLVKSSLCYPDDFGKALDNQINASATARDCG